MDVVGGLFVDGRNYADGEGEVVFILDVDVVLGDNQGKLKS